MEPGEAGLPTGAVFLSIMRIPRFFILVLGVRLACPAPASAANPGGKPLGGASAAPAVAHSPTIFAKNPVSSPYLPATLRRHYELAAADKAAGETFYKLLADYKDRDALVLGFKAAAEAIRARDASMFNKLTYVQDAARTFEQAVGLDPHNPEIRFLRFSVESNLPAFLGLSKHVDEDKEMLLNAALTHPRSGLDAEAFRTVRLRHFLGSKDTRQKAWALADDQGFIRELSPAFAQALQSHWPAWHGSRLPDALARCVVEGRAFKAKALTVDVRQSDNLRFLEVKARSPLDRLTAREGEIVTRYAHGETYSAIAAGLALSPATVRNHISHCFKKLGVTNKAELANLLSNKTRAAV